MATFALLNSANSAAAYSTTSLQNRPNIRLFDYQR